MSILLNQFDKMNCKFDEQKSEIKEIKSNFNDKFNEQNNEIKLMRDEIKQQSFDFNKHINEINTRLDTFAEQVLESISSSCEKRIDEMNKNSECKFNQILNKKLDDNVRGMTNINDCLLCTSRCV